MEASSEETLERSVYLDTRWRMIEARQRAEQRVDQLVVGGASGALVLSVTFLDRMAPSPLTSTRWLVMASWSLLLAALLSALFSHVASARAFEEHLAAVDEDQRKGGPPPVPRKKTITACTVEWLNRTSMALFISGVAILALFAYLNIGFH